MVTLLLTLTFIYVTANGGTVCLVYNVTIRAGTLKHVHPVHLTVVGACGWAVSLCAVSLTLGGIFGRHPEPLPAHTLINPIEFLTQHVLTFFTDFDVHTLSIFFPEAVFAPALEPSLGVHTLLILTFARVLPFTLIHVLTVLFVPRQPVAVVALAHIGVGLLLAPLRAVGARNCDEWICGAGEFVLMESLPLGTHAGV